MSTKDVLEDLIGESKDVATRDQKKASGQAPERTFFYNTRSGRIRHLKPLELQKGDYASKTFRSADCHRDAVFCQKNKVPKDGVLADLKEICRRGAILCYTRCSTLDPCAVDQVCIAWRGR